MYVAVIAAIASCRAFTVQLSKAPPPLDFSRLHPLPLPSPPLLYHQLFSSLYFHFGCFQTTSAVLGSVSFSGIQLIQAATAAAVGVLGGF